MSSLDFELRHPRGELGAVPNPGLPQHVRDVPLDRLSGEEEPAARSQGCSPLRRSRRAIASSRSVSALPPAPRRQVRTPERSQPLLCELGNGLGAALGRDLGPLENVLGTAAVALRERGAEIKTRPERIEAEAEPVRLARRGFEQLARDRVAKERLDASLQERSRACGRACMRAHSASHWAASSEQPTCASASAPARRSSVAHLGQPTRSAHARAVATCARTSSPSSRPPASASQTAASW